MEPMKLVSTVFTNWFTLNYFTTFDPTNKNSGKIMKSSFGALCTEEQLRIVVMAKQESVKKEWMDKINQYVVLHNGNHLPHLFKPICIIPTGLDNLQAASLLWMSQQMNRIRTETRAPNLCPFQYHPPLQRTRMNPTHSQNGKEPPR